MKRLSSSRTTVEDNPESFPPSTKIRTITSTTPLPQLFPPVSYLPVADGATSDRIRTYREVLEHRFIRNAIVRSRDEIRNLFRKSGKDTPPTGHSVSKSVFLRRKRARIAQYRFYPQSTMHGFFSSSAHLYGYFPTDSGQKRRRHKSIERIPVGRMPIDPLTSFVPASGIGRIFTHTESVSVWAMIDPGISERWKRQQLAFCNSLRRRNSRDASQHSDRAPPSISTMCSFSS